MGDTTAEIREVQKAVSDLAGHVLTLAKRVYAKDEDLMPYEEEGDMMPYEDEEEKGRRGMKYAKKGKQSKGFADSAEDAADEEDAAFGESPDADIDANEPVDPAAAPKSPPFSGDREDETFNVKAMMKAIGELTAKVDALSGGSPGAGAQTIVKAQIPGGGDRPTGREIGSGEVVTREMQKEAKSRSWREINALREQVGDLPRFGFAG